MTRPIVITLALLATAASAHYHHHDHDNGCDGEECNWDWNLMFNSNQSIDDSFRECFCYNETSRTWCANDPHAPGATYFLRTSCRRMISNLFIWDSFAIIPLFVFLLFPLLFCMGRLLCNCCGGRQPSYGCCCPADNKLVSADPKFKRPYSRCSIWFATILAVAIVVAAVVFCALGLKLNRGLHNQVGFLRQQWSMISSQMAFQAEDVFSAIHRSGIADSAEFDALSSRMNSFYIDVVHGLSDLHNGENKRNEWMKVTIAVPLATLALLLVFCIARIRGWAVTLLANVLCLLAAVACVSMVGYMALWTATDTVCNNKDHFNNFMFNVTCAETGAGVRGTVFGWANQTLIQAVNTACDQGLRQLCAKDVFDCQDNICENMFVTSSSYFSNTAFIMPSTDKWSAAWESSNAPASRNLTNIYRCAFDSSCKYFIEATTLHLHFYKNVTKLFDDVYSNGPNAIPAVLYPGGMYSQICSQVPWTDRSLQDDLRLVAYNQLALMLICFVGTFVFIHGSKRFVMYHKQSQDPREARDEALAYVTAQPVHSDHEALLIANADDRVPLPAMSNYAKTYGSINRGTIRQSDDVEEYPSKPNPEEV